jgi:photosystem II stability/assembly factor-like uncharacterized protein
MIKVPCKITLTGDKDCARNFVGTAQSQLRILESEMGFQNLKQGTRRTRFNQRTTVEARICFDLREVIIYCLPVGERVGKAGEKTNFVALAGTWPNGRIYRSTDYGKMWVSIFRSYSEPVIHCLAYGNKVCIAGTGYDGRIYRSTDYGKEWNNIYFSGSKDVKCLAYVDGDVFLVGTEGPTPEMRRSTNAGLTWPIIDTYGGNYLQSVVHLEDGICLTTLGGSAPAPIYRSTDYGITWSYAASPAAGENIIFDFTYLGDGICLAGTANNGHIIRSTDYGVTWSDLGGLSYGGLNATAVMALTYTKNGICLAGATLRDPGVAWYPSVFRSTDYGVTWSFVYQNSASDEFRSLAYIDEGVCIGGLADAAAAGAYAGKDRIIRSANYGKSWTDIGSIGSENGVMSLVAFETNPQVI